MNTEIWNFWSKGGESPDDPDLDIAGKWNTGENSEGVMELEPKGRYYRGKIKLETGAAVLNICSPRPLRVWIDNNLLLHMPLYRFHFAHQTAGAVVFPVRKEGIVDILVEAGPRPYVEPRIFRESPSRERDRVMEQMEKAAPDVLTFRLEPLEGGHFQPFGLRFSQTQYVREGVIWQRAVLYPSANTPITLLDTETPPDGCCFQDRAGEADISASCAVFPYDARIEKAGEGRLFLDIPVMDDKERGMPVRSDKRTDPRFEPSREIVGQGKLSVCCNGDPVAVCMPVYEPLGRFAPRREYSGDDRISARPVPADTPAQGSDRAAWSMPELILPDRLLPLQKLYRHAADMLRRLVSPVGEKSGLTGPYISTGSGFAGKQFVWDTAFTVIASKYFAKYLPVYTALDNVYSRQFDGGYIHREWGVQDGLPLLYEPGFSPNPPLLSQAEWELAENTGDKIRLKRVYPALCAYHRWLYQNRRLPDGTYWTTGLASGVDNAPSLGEGYPCLTSQMVQDAFVLENIARVLGFHEDAQMFADEASVTARALNDKLWNADTQFYSATLKTGGHNPEKLAVNFWPLWAKVPTKEQTEALLRHLNNPEEFCRHHRLPSLSADSAYFCPEGEYWRGSVWPPLVYMVVEGLKGCGEIPLAREIAENHARCMAQVLEATGDIWENYCSERSVRGNISMHDYGWSALGATTMLIETVLGIRTFALENRISFQPLPEKCEIRNLPYKGGYVSLSQQIERGFVYVQAEAPAGTLLCYRLNSKEQTVRCSGQRQSFSFPLADIE